jgi:resolvase-like protein
LIRAYCTSTYQSQRRWRRSSKRSRSKKAKARTKTLAKNSAARRDRPRWRSAAEQRDEHTARSHSITSARARSVGGTSRPSAFARLHWQVEIVRVYKDHSISGTRGRDKRPAFDKLCRDAARREFDVVMAWSVDRLGRSLQDLVPDVLREHPELVATGRLTLLQSLPCVRLVLWDEDGRRLSSFRDRILGFRTTTC